MVDQSFPKHLRLRSRSDFRRVYERRCSVGDDVLRLLGKLSDLDYPRIGLSVSRQVGGAVERNRWKRLLREAFRLSCDQLPVGLDFIVVPRSGAPPNLQPLMKSLANLAWRLHKRLKREASTARHEQREQNSRAEAQRRKDGDD